MEPPNHTPRPLPNLPQHGFKNANLRRRLRPHARLLTMSGFGVKGGMAKDGKVWGGRKPAIKSGSPWTYNLAFSLDMRSPTNIGISPHEADLLSDKFAPRAFADYTSGLSGTFQASAPGGSFVGSPPRSRDKFHITPSKMQYLPY